MDFLRMLEGIRTPVLDGFMSVVTYLGSEILFMALAVLVFWCVSKKQGYYLFTVGLAGVVINQFLKLWFRIPRPWVLDPNFSIVESARAEATGYSFPSGHTQNIVGTLGVIAVSNRQKWVRVLCIVFILLGRAVGMRLVRQLNAEVIKRAIYLFVGISGAMTLIENIL